jgi:hypothetical protein
MLKQNSVKVNPGGRSIECDNLIYVFDKDGKCCAQYIKLAHDCVIKL